MHFSAGIISTGSYLPSKKLTNSDLEKMIDTTDAWIMERTGIRERRIVDNNEAASDLASRAGKEAIRRAQLSPEDIDMLIVATGTPDRLFPSTAARTSHLLSLSIKCGAFDLMAACAGFNYALEIAARMVGCGSHKNILVIGAEVLSKYVDWKDRTTCILFGDGAGAVVVGRVKEGFGLIDSAMYTDGNLADLLEIPAGGSLLPASAETVAKGLHYIKMNGREVFKQAVARLSESCLEILKKNGLTPQEINIFIPHQANSRILKAIVERVGFNEKQFYSNVLVYGNTSSASIPIALDEAVKEGRIKEGDLMMFAGFGSGFVWGVSIMRYGGREKSIEGA